MPTREELTQRTRAELRLLAKEQGLKRISKLRKAELIDALLAAGDEPKQPEERPAAEPETITPAATADLHPDAQVGAKFTTGDLPEEAREEEDEEDIEIPEHYGTRRVFLAARDPRWFHSYWDFSDQQLEDGRRAAADGVHRLRLMEEGEARRIVEEIALPPGARNWYFQHDRPGSGFSVRLGYLREDERFVEMGASNVVQAPNDEPTAAAPEEFASISVDVPFRAEAEEVEGQESEGGDRPTEEEEEPSAATEESAGESSSEAPQDTGAGVESPAAKEPLADAESSDTARPPIEVDAPPLAVHHPGRLARAGTPAPPPADDRGFHAAPARSDATSAGAPGAPRAEIPGAPGAGPWAGPLGASWSRPIGASWSAAPGAPGEFRMRVNAEVVIYGDTVPGARVVANGEEIECDRSGRFAFHYHLPDGEFRLDVGATAPDRSETRAARVNFGRQTSTYGEVGVHPHSPDLPDPPGVRAKR